MARAPPAPFVRHRGVVGRAGAVGRKSPGAASAPRGQDMQHGATGAANHKRTRVRDRTQKVSKSLLLRLGLRGSIWPRSIRLVAVKAAAQSGRVNLVLANQQHKGRTAFMPATCETRNPHDATHHDQTWAPLKLPELGFVNQATYTPGFDDLTSRTPGRREEAYTELYNAIADMYYREGYYGMAYWFCLGAAHHDPASVYNLGILYRDGCGCQTNGEFAHGCFVESAVQGFAPAMVRPFTLLVPLAARLSDVWPLSGRGGKHVPRWTCRRARPPRCAILVLPSGRRRERHGMAEPRLLLYVWRGWPHVAAAGRRMLRLGLCAWVWM